MSTYYHFYCPKCDEAGGFFSRQMWGWGNCDIFSNFKFHVAHAHCGPIHTISEHEERWFNAAPELKWLERLAADENLREETWPHASEWDWVAESWEGAHLKWDEEFVKDLDRERREEEERASR